MKLSAVILSYRRPQFLQEALESIANQTRAPDQIIFSDCTSPDDPNYAVIQKIWNAFAERHSSRKIQATFHNSPIEQTAHTHFAVSQCVHPLVAMLHDDDAWMPIHLERSQDALSSNLQLGLCISNAITVDSSSSPISKTSHSHSELPNTNAPHKWFRYLIRRYFSSFSGYVFRKSLFDDFPRSPTQVVDHHLALHTCLKGLHILPFLEPSLRYRVHTDSSDASITQRFSLQNERYRLYPTILRRNPLRSIQLMPLFPLFVIKGLAKLANNRL